MRGANVWPSKAARLFQYRRPFSAPRVDRFAPGTRFTEARNYFRDPRPSDRAWLGRAGPCLRAVYNRPPEVHAITAAAGSRPTRNSNRGPATSADTPSARPAGHVDLYRPWHAEYSQYRPIGGGRGTRAAALPSVAYRRVAVGVRDSSDSAVVSAPDRWWLHYGQSWSPPAGARVEPASTVSRAWIWPRRRPAAIADMLAAERFDACSTRR